MLGITVEGLERQFTRSLFRALTVRRLQRRFARIERVLRKRYTNALPAHLKQARAENLARLHEYWTRGRFPRNYEYAKHTPAFVDRDGTTCAVAHLVRQSGQIELSNRIVIAANDARVPEIAAQVPQLAEWAAKSGLSVDELVYIQPSYPCEFNAALYHLNGLAQGYASLAALCVSVGLANFVRSLFWTRSITAQRVGLVIGVTAGLTLVALTFLQAVMMNAMQHSNDAVMRYSSNYGWATCPQLNTARDFVHSVYNGGNAAYASVGIFIIVLSLIAFARIMRMKRQAALETERTNA